MTQQIQRSEWKQFFDKFNSERLDWETSIQVLSEESGAQMLSEGLPFSGLTYDETDGECNIELLVGSGAENHQLHTIVAPKSIAFEGIGEVGSGTLDIEDASGTKTLIKFVKPVSGEEKKSGSAAG